ncbi:hypothetical protein [Streptomyces yatensis]|uniref:Secreted protein n=1 Tax=Streptomyces yatensis TaxID=155177 RepID=A0ABN2IND9_9ACTN|nr:hypothetical protein [Streptomyces yatensis]
MSTKRLSSQPKQSVGESPSTLLRTAMVGIVLAVLAAVAGLVGYLTRPGAPEQPAPSGSKPVSSMPRATPHPGAKDAVARPPHTSDPVTFAKAATTALWAYDTRDFSRTEHLTGLQEWMTGEKRYRDWKSVSDQVPSKQLWSRMHDNQQHAAASVDEGHLPEAFKSAMSQDPGAITQAYVYAVTVTGKQSIAWKGSGAGAEPRSTTLAVQCRPDHDCALSGVLPEVAP